MTDQLWRRYRRLLFLYPRAYRAEMATTLVDAAPPGRTRPRPHEAAGLVLRGLLWWLRVRGAGATVVTVLISGYAAVALGGFGGWLGWQTAPALPGNADVTRMAGPVSNRWDFIFDDNPKYTDPRWVYLVGGTDEYRYGEVFVEAPVDGAADRLRAAGWRVESRDGGLALTRTTPGAVLPLTTVGLVLGGLAGWLAAAWGYRRQRRAGPVWRAVAIVLAGAGLLALLPATAWSAIGIVQSFRQPHDPVPGWIGYVFILFRPLAYLGILALLGAVMAARPGRHRQLV